MCGQHAATTTTFGKEFRPANFCDIFRIASICSRSADTFDIISERDSRDYRKQITQGEPHFRAAVATVCTFECPILAMSVCESSATRSKQSTFETREGLGLWTTSRKLRWLHVASLEIKHRNGFQWNGAKQRIARLDTNW